MSTKDLSGGPDRPDLRGKAKRGVRVLVIHGIGEDCQGFSTDFQTRVNKGLGEYASNVRWQEVYWAEVTRSNQMSYLRSCEPEHRLGGWPWRKLRTWVLKALGDAAAYQLVSQARSTVYGEIQARVRAGVESLLSRHAPDTPLVIVAHSMGAHIASTFIRDTRKSLATYIYFLGSIDRETPVALRSATHDAIYREIAEAVSGDVDDLKNNYPDAAANDDDLQGARNSLMPKSDGFDIKNDLEEAFLRLQTLSGIITVGANLPLFTFPFRPADIVPICIPGAPSGFHVGPGKGLDTIVDPQDDKVPLSQRKRWLNFFAPSDPLGYPLRPLNASYAASVHADIHVRPLFPLGKASTPLSHTLYWRNQTVCRQTALFLRSLMDAPADPPPTQDGDKLPGE